MKLKNLVFAGTILAVTAGCKTGSDGGSATLDATVSGSSALTDTTMNLDVVDFDISGFPEAPSRPKTPPEASSFGISPYIGGYEVWPGYVIKDLATWIKLDQDEGPFAVNLADCFRKSYWRLYKILQNPPAEYLKMVKEHQGPGSFYVFINDVRQGFPSAGWNNRLVNYKDSLVKWIANWDGQKCTQRTRQDLIDFSVKYMQSHPPGWRSSQN